MSDEQKKRCGTCRWVSVNSASYFLTYQCAFPLEIPSAYLNRHQQSGADMLGTRIHAGGPPTSETAGVHCPTWAAKEER